MAKLTDESLMPYGKYKGDEMIDVPPEYLLWIFENNKCTAEVRAYITDNMDAIKEEIVLNKGQNRQ